MPDIGRLVLYSAILATVIYNIINLRRRRTGQKSSRTQAIAPVVEYQACEDFLTEELQDISSVKQFGSVEELQICPQIAVDLPSFTKLTLCTSLCFCVSESTVTSPAESLDINSAPMTTSVLPTLNVNEDVIGSASGSIACEVQSGAAYNLHFTDSVDSESDARTPESNEPTSSPEEFEPFTLPSGCFNDPVNDIIEANPEELGGKLLPKVLIPSEMWAEAVDNDMWHETFCIPAHMGGVLIGRLGKNVRELRTLWQAEFSLNVCPGRQDTLLFHLSCPLDHRENVLHWVSRRFKMRPSKTPIGNPNQLRRFLPLGEVTPVHIRSLYGLKEFFVTMQDEQYARYISMQNELDKDYGSLNNFRMQLCEPVTSGTVAVVPHSQGFCRALVLSVYSTTPKCAHYFLLDHGTFGVVPLSKLRKIRAKYMRVPFQAIHVSWAHAFPMFSDVPDIHVLRTLFASGQTYAHAVRMETCCRASVVFAEPYTGAPGLLDTLVSACHNGLCTVVPLTIYPNRQAWLNRTGIPYYPATFSTIDYTALVSMVPDESMNSSAFLHPYQSRELEASTSRSSGQQRNKSGMSFRNGYNGWISGNWYSSSGQHRGNHFSRGGFNSVRRPAYGQSRRQVHQPNNLSFEGTTTASQKENEHNRSPSENTPKSASSKYNEKVESPVTNPKCAVPRRPLAARNCRSGATINRKGANQSSVSQSDKEASQT